MPIPLPLLLAGLYATPGLIFAIYRAAVRLEDPEKPHDLVLFLYFAAEWAMWPLAMFLAAVRGG